MSATELPPLPEPEPLGTAYDDRARPIVAYGYTPSQMRAYALQANVDLAAESERLRALLAECFELNDNWPGIAYSYDLYERVSAALAAKDSP